MEKKREKGKKQREELAEAGWLPRAARVCLPVRAGGPAGPV